MTPDMLEEIVKRVGPFSNIRKLTGYLIIAYQRVGVKASRQRLVAEINKNQKATRNEYEPAFMLSPLSDGDQC